MQYPSEAKSVFDVVIYAKQSHMRKVKETKRNRDIDTLKRLCGHVTEGMRYNGRMEMIIK
jgi:hypothetical protein